MLLRHRLCEVGSERGFSLLPFFYSLPYRKTIGVLGGLATRLIRRVGREARKRGFSEVKLDRMVGATQRLMKKEQGRGQGKSGFGRTKEIWVGPTGLGIGGRITFKGMRKKPM